MEKHDRLSDFDHPEIQRIAHERCENRDSIRDKAEGLFHFVRDEIPFGFPKVWDEVRASETLKYKVGYCTTKATLFHALCQAADIPSRIHAGMIKVEVMRGILPGFAFHFLPEVGSHAWMEIKLDDRWHPIDTYINDQAFYQKALHKLEDSGRKNGFSISLEKDPSSCEFNFGEIGFVQMGAVVEDHGTWEDLSRYMSSNKYTRMTPLQATAYTWVLRRAANKNIHQIRTG
jgi:hypothetical protein